MNVRRIGAARPATLLAMGLLAFCACDRGSAKKKGQDGDDIYAPPRPVAPVTAASVLHSYPHDTAAFTQGLLWHDGMLYESTGREGRSTLRKVELQTGTVVKKVDVPAQYFAEGLALLEGKLYQLTWQNQQGFIYDLADFRQVGRDGGSRPTGGR
jgi:glutamine cyclotransferase